MLQGVSEGGASQLGAMMPKDASLSESYTPDRCSFSSLTSMYNDCFLHRDFIAESMHLMLKELMHLMVF